MAWPLPVGTQLVRIWEIPNRSYENQRSMRLIGSLADEHAARTLADHLLTLDITTRLMPGSDGWQIWVHREDKVPQAAAEFAAFQKDPDADVYQGVSARARSLRKQADKVEREHYEKSYDVRYFWSSRDFRRCPVSWLLIVASIAVTLATGFGRGRDDWTRALLIARYEERPLSEIPESGLIEGEIVQNRWIWSNPLVDLRRGEVWRLVTPIFLHFDWLHLGFNMYWMYVLGTVIEIKIKSWRFALFVLVAAVVSNLGQYYSTNLPMFGGMSGVDLALFGFAWMKGMYEPELGLGLSRSTVLMMILFLGFSITAGMNFAHAAHLVGLACGMIIALAPHLIPIGRPAREE